MSVSTGEQLYEHLQESRLFSAEQLADLHDELLAKPSRPAGGLADELVKRGLITLWQARQLLSGRHAFFVGKYKLLECLGTGGMGTVYKAYHAMTDRVVALKLVSKAILANPPAVARFRTEVRLICSLNHPNIITAYDADSVGDMHFLVMEFGQGRDLRAWLKEHGPLPVDWACDCIRQAALALDHAHQRGLVHRDIKPENILADGADLTTPPTVKLLDMGLARLMHEEPAEDAELTGEGRLMGTPDYVSPEQAMQAGDADIRSDIYSLGATFYKILTGEVPFEGGDVRQRLMARLVNDAPRASGRRDDLPEEVDEIVARMLAREPDDRFQTPAELAEALFPFSFEGQRTAAGAVNAAVAHESDHALGSFFDRMAEEEDDVPLQPVQAVQPVREAVSGPSPRRATSGRRQAPRRNWVVGVVVGCAISVPVVALMFWGMRSATLVLNWPLDQRRGSQLLVDGDVLAVPNQNPAAVSVPAGKRRVVIRRRGYDPIEWTLDLTRGQQIKKRVAFEKTDLSRPFRFGTGDK
ncbi:MAG TPA: serine/threonine-protein kinase [Pirellulales bacterium]|nr:serine/threonine-protein kinase [Pirellulales bacterium]